MLRLALAVGLFLTGSLLHAAEPLRVCLLSGSAEYKSDESLAGFQKAIEKAYPVRCDLVKSEGDDQLGSLEPLDHCDVLVIFTRRVKTAGKPLEQLKKYCLSGRPVVGIRTASHAFQNWLELDKTVFGGNYKNHYPAGPETDIKLTTAGEQHPVTAGFVPFRSVSSLYRNTGVASDVDVLLTGTIPEHTEPLAWTREYQGTDRKGRVFYTSLGHPQDFTEPAFEQLLVRALFWTAERDLPTAQKP